MKMLFLLPVAGLAVASCGLTGCGSQGNAAVVKPKVAQTQDKTYSNEFFSVKYPSDWAYEEEINDLSDEVPLMTKGVLVTFYDPDPFKLFHTVMIQKSSMPDVFDTPEEWRDASVELKEVDPEYLGVIDFYMQDSLSFGGYPSAAVGFVVATEHGDTLIHKQLVVMAGRDLYYLNNTFNYLDETGMEEKGDSILSTFRVK